MKVLLETLLVLLALEWLNDLDLAQLLVTLDRLDEDLSPALELFLVMEGHLHDRFLIRCHNLNELLTGFPSTPTHLAESKIN